ncbi:hypothetical protein B1748_09220 [Paenibacillus sp. MY03]|uniref:helix-turn-helix domain-containing protein n=1 Tax=Paenibacillus sp. MY03 TaxID=302980 RepID=UPI000B3C8ACC|nr:AraC family transcriptional regulator [Paenibacillus sp. MY03]OUS76766.1 hypothetical protein B1748_09220 [Paenibacillus sp. MY03]
MNGIRTHGLAFTNKLFIKILLCFLSLLVPIVIIGSYVYNDVKGLAERDVSQKLANNLVSSIQTIDLHLGMAHSTINNLLIGDIIQQHLRPYSELGDTGKMNMQLIVRAVGAHQNTYSSFIESIFLYIDKDKVYTGDGVIDFPIFFEKFYRSSEYDTDYWSEQLEKSDFFKLLPATVMKNYGNTGKRVIPSVTTRYINGELATMVTSLSLRAIEQNLRSHSIYNSTGYLVLDQYKDSIINDRVDDASIDLIRQEVTEPGQAEFLTVNGKRSLVILTGSEDLGWDYYSITPVASFSHESQRILDLLIWICISLMIIGIFFSFVFSVHLYNPIRNIHNILTRNELRDKAVYERRSNDELKMIGNRIYQLMNQNNEAVNQLNQYSNELLDHFFITLINGNPAAQLGTTRQMLDKIGFQGGRYLCCCFMFQYKERFNSEIKKPERALIQDKLKNVLWGIMRQYVTCYTVKHEQNFYVCLIQLQSQEDRAQLNRALDNIKNTFAYDMVYCELTIGLGKVYDSVHDLGKSYNDALTVINRIDGDSSIQIVDAIDIRIEGTYYYSFPDQKKIVNVLRAGNREQLEAEVRDLIEMNVSRNVAYKYMGMLLVELMNTGIRYLNEKQMNRQKLLSLSEETALGGPLLNNELEERVGLLLDFYMRIIDESEAGKIENRKTEAVVASITQYIELHFAKDIYLETIADEIGLSAKYISRMFKESTGVTISDYINGFRMDKAKQLLVNTDMKITDIAEQVGINSRTTFLRVFKKHEGLSPTDYRNVRPAGQKHD